MTPRYSIVNDGPPCLSGNRKNEMPRGENWFHLEVFLFLSLARSLATSLFDEFKNSPAAWKVPGPVWWSPRVRVSRAFPGTNPPVDCSYPEASAGVARSRNYRRRSGRTTWNRVRVSLDLMSLIRSSFRVDRNVSSFSDGFDYSYREILIKLPF